MKIQPVKYHLIKPPYLLEGSSGTEFIYEIKNLVLNEDSIQELNSMNDGLKTNTIQNKGGTLIFKRCNTRIFSGNLTMIDSRMPLLLSELILISYNKELESLKAIISELEYTNSVFSNIFIPQKICAYKIRELIKSIVLGLNATEIWNGEPNLYEHFPVLKIEHELIFYSDDPYKFVELLISNSEINRNIETSTGIVYKQNNETYLNLPFQINLKT